MTSQALRAIPVLFLSVLLMSCGFQLRSYNVGSNVESYALGGNVDLAVVPPLRRTLDQAGLNQVSEGANLLVELLDQRRDRRSVSTTGQTRVAEYETSYGVRYRLLDAAGQELLPPTWVQRSRVYRVNRENIVGSAEEQALLEREMLQEVVGQIMRSISIVTQPAAT